MVQAAFSCLSRVARSLLPLGICSGTQKLCWDANQRSLHHSTKQAFTSNGARVRTGSQKKITKNGQFSGQLIFQTISAFPKQGIESHYENACFELFLSFGSQGRRREGLEGFGRFWEGLGGFPRFGKVWAGLVGLEGWGEGLGPFKRIWEGLGRFGSVWEVWESLGRFGNI